MNDFKRCRIENLVRSIDRAKERISYFCMRIYLKG